MTDLVSSRTRINQPEIPDPPPPPADAGPPEMEPAREPLCTEEEADALVAEVRAIPCPAPGKHSKDHARPTG